MIVGRDLVTSVFSADVPDKLTSVSSVLLLLSTLDEMRLTVSR